MKIVTSKFINQVLEDNYSIDPGSPPLPLICEDVFFLDLFIYDQLNNKEKVFYGINEIETNAQRSPDKK